MQSSCGVMGSWRRWIRGLEGLLLLDLSRMEGLLSFINHKRNNTGRFALCTDTCVKVHHGQSYRLNERFDDRSQAISHDGKRQYAAIHV